MMSDHAVRSGGQVLARGAARPGQDRRALRRLHGGHERCVCQIERGTVGLFGV